MSKTNQAKLDARINDGLIAVGSNQWKTYVANAIAVAPEQRTETQKREIDRAMRGEDR